MGRTKRAPVLRPVKPLDGELYDPSYVFVRVARCAKDPYLKSDGAPMNFDLVALGWKGMLDQVCHRLYITDPSSTTCVLHAAGDCSRVLGEEDLLCGAGYEQVFHAHVVSQDGMPLSPPRPRKKKFSKVTTRVHAPPTSNFIFYDLPSPERKPRSRKRKAGSPPQLPSLGPLYNFMKGTQNRRRSDRIAARGEESSMARSPRAVSKALPKARPSHVKPMTPKHHREVDRALQEAGVSPLTEFTSRPTANARTAAWVASGEVPESPSEELGEVMDIDEGAEVGGEATDAMDVDEVPAEDSAAFADNSAWNWSQNPLDSANTIDSPYNPTQGNSQLITGPDTTMVSQPRSSKKRKVVEEEKEDVEVEEEIEQQENDDEEEDQAQLPKYVRLGMMPQLRDAGPSKGEDDEEDDEVILVMDFVAVAHKGEDEDKDEIVYDAVPVWTINGVEIGDYQNADRITAQPWKATGEHRIQPDRFFKAAFANGTVEALVRSILEDPATLKTQDKREPPPLKPTYSPHDYVPTNLPVRDNKSNINVVVEYINKVAENADWPEGLKGLPINTQATVKMNETFKAFNTFAVDSTIIYDTPTNMNLKQALAKIDHWTAVEIWVLPQRHTVDGTMFQWKEENKWTVREFLEEGNWADGDRELYFEVHVVERAPTAQELKKQHESGSVKKGMAKKKTAEEGKKKDTPAKKGTAKKTTKKTGKK